MDERAAEQEPKSVREPETEERLGNALAAVFGSFAASSALAARVQRGPRAAAFRDVARHSASRQQAMALQAEKLQRRLDEDATRADRFAEARLPDSPTGRTRASKAGQSEGAVSLAIPGLKRDIGLGDAISKLTAVFGLNDCGGCARRAAALNRALTFRATNPEK